MEKNYWNHQLDYLKKSRKIIWNFDYLQFLVNKVWKIHEPVNVADFGCGTGFLAEVLLPILPIGSTYTGFDYSQNLIEEARNKFFALPYQTKFICTDLIEEKVEGTFDVVICQAFLMHIPNPITMLSKMISSLDENGIVICIETDWNVANAALFIDGIDINSYANLSVLQKLWSFQNMKNSVDRCIGMKIPVMMQKLGLHDVDIRMNDCVRFVNPYANQESYHQQLETFLSEGWNQEMNDEETFIANLLKRGLSEEEAKKQYNLEKTIKEFIKIHKNELFALSLPPMFISYGRK